PRAPRSRPGPAVGRGGGGLLRAPGPQAAAAVHPRRARALRPPRVRAGARSAEVDGPPAPELIDADSRRLDVPRSAHPKRSTSLIRGAGVTVCRHSHIADATPTLAPRPFPPRGSPARYR